MVWKKLYCCIWKRRKIIVLKALKGFCKWNSSDDLKISYLLCEFQIFAHKDIHLHSAYLAQKKLKTHWKSRHPKTYRAIPSYLYCVKHLQRVAFGTVKFNRLMELLGFVSSQLCSNAILLRSRAVCYGFQFCSTQILMIC